MGPENETAERLGSGRVASGRGGRAGEGRDRAGAKAVGESADIGSGTGTTGAAMMGVPVAQAAGFEASAAGADKCMTSVGE